MHRLCRGPVFFFKSGCLCDKTLFFSYLLAPSFYVQVPRYKCYIIALEFFLCIGYAQVMHRLCRGPGFSSNVIAYAIKRCFSLIYSPQFFFVQVPRYKYYIIALEFFLCIGYAQVLHRLCRGPGFSSNVIAFAIKSCFSLIYSPHFFYAQVPRHIITLQLVLCKGYAQVMQRSRFFFKCGCLCDKRCSFLIYSPQIFICTVAAL